MAVVDDGRFCCPGCVRRRLLEDRHPLGFCTVCMRRGRSFWLRRLEWAEIVELGGLLWPEDRGRELAA